MKKVKGWVGIAIVLTGVLLAGCGQSKADSAKSANKDPQTGQVYPKTVKVGLIEGGPESAILQKEHYLKGIGTKVKTTSYSTGTDLNNAFVSKDLDVASFGSSPYALGVANGVPYKAVGVPYVESGNIEALAAKKSASIKKVADLKGKKIGVPFATTSHYALLKALALAGLKPSDVTLKDMDGQSIVAAWKRGDIDAAYIWSPALDEIAKTGRILTNDGQLKNKGVIIPEVAVSGNDFSKKYPTLVKRYVQALIKVQNLVKTNPKRAIQDVASWEGIPTANAKGQITENDWLSGNEQADYLGSDGKLADIVKTITDFHKAQKNISQAPTKSTINDAIDGSFLQKALK